MCFLHIQYVKTHSVCLFVQLRYVFIFNSFWPDCKNHLNEDDRLLGYILKNVGDFYLNAQKQLVDFARDSAKFLIIYFTELSFDLNYSPLIYMIITKNNISKI